MRVNADHFMPMAFERGINYFFLKPNADNAKILREGESVWPLILDLPRRGITTGEFPRGKKLSEPADEVYVYETGMVFVDFTRRELTTPIIRPMGHRRILKIAWACEHPVEVDLVSVARLRKEAAQTGNMARLRDMGNLSSQKYTRREPPGEPEQPFALRRRLSDYPAASVRFFIATWESPFISKRS